MNGSPTRLKVPFRTVMSIAINGIRIRFWRSMVTAAGIMLGIAFLSYVMTSLIGNPNASADQQAQQKWLAVMSLLVSTVGIANSMLMSVSERFREIGTMKCLGAPDDFVVALFFFEALITGIFASAFGWLVGFGMGIVGLQMSGNTIHLAALEVIKLAVGCIVIGAILTLIATIAPANQAAKMPAAAALRSDV